MDDKKRTMILAGILTAVIAVYGGKSFVTNKIMLPVTKLKGEIAAQEKKLDQLGQDEIALGIARRDIQDWRDISLPEDSSTAQRLYREWIENLALECSFSNVSVEPGRKSDQRGKMLTVGVDVKAETDLAGLSRFMFLFDNAAILHRLSNLTISSTGTQGNPRMEISFTAEGASVGGSGIRSELFSRTSLTGDISESAEELVVKSSELFPAATPFEVRIDRELVRVTEVSGNKWKVTRAVTGTKAATHKKDTTIELLPVLYSKKNRSFEEYSGFLSSSPFAVPSPPKKYSPKLAGLTDKSIKPGEIVNLALRIDDADPGLGAAQFELEDPIEGMSINPETGEVSWETADSLADGKYTARVTAIQAGRPEMKFEGQFTVSVITPNLAPKIEPFADSIAVIGQPFAKKITATDDGPADQLVFSVSGVVPAGMKIDAKTGELTWTPDISQKPGEYEIELKVTDAGKQPQSANTTVKLNLRDDDAAMTLLTGSVSKDDIWYAWLRNKATGQQMQLRTGERITMAEIDAEIIAIEPREIVLQDSAGVWKVELGKTVRQRELMKAAEPPATNSQHEPAAEKNDTKPILPQNEATTSADTAQLSSQENGGQNDETLAEAPIEASPPGDN